MMRAFKTVNDAYIEPISFVVPRRSEVFQGDIYPPATGTKPAMSSSEWFRGKEGLPPKIDLESVYDGGAATEVQADYQASSQTPALPSATPKESEIEPARVKEEEPIEPPSAAIGSAPLSMKDQASSIGAMASKFADKDEAADQEEDDDDTSSFEEVTKPVDRSGRSLPVDTKTDQKVAAATASPQKAPAAIFMASIPKEAPSTPSSLPGSDQPLPTPTSLLATSTQITPDQPSRSSSTDGPPISGYLQEIKTLLEQQTKTMADQNEKIGRLSSEVDMLKMSVGDKDKRRSLEKDARIEALERELKGLKQGSERSG